MNYWDVHGILFLLGCAFFPRVTTLLESIASAATGLGFIAGGVLVTATAPEVAYAVSWAYSPLAPAVIEGPEPVRRVLKWWIGVGMPARTEFHGDWSRGVGWSNPGYTYTLWHY